ncbi:hypothetical protein B0H14DRAFT_2622333 [Mycena olivaceomarginata]|nr:hypothetical protein B0H14DRAFT_2622333 [Mycena olivaceomarginata]
MSPISITVTVAEAADPEFLGKRKGNKQGESLRPAKRKRKVENGGSDDKDERQKTELRNRGAKAHSKGRTEKPPSSPDIMMLNTYLCSKQQTLTADPERVESEQELKKVKRCDRICRDLDAVLEISGAVEQYRFGCGDAVKRVNYGGPLLAPDGWIFRVRNAPKECCLNLA